MSKQNQNEIKTAAIPKQKSVQEIMSQTGNAADLKVPTAEEWAAYLKSKAETDAKLLELAGEVQKMKESKARAPQVGFRKGSVNEKAEELLKAMGLEYDGDIKIDLDPDIISRMVIKFDNENTPAGEAHRWAINTVDHQIRKHFMAKGWTERKAKVETKDESAEVEAK